MIKDIEAPNFIGISSSKIGENSWSHRYDMDVGTSLADRFTSFMVEKLLEHSDRSKEKITDFVQRLSYIDILSHPTVHVNKLSGDVKEATFSDFTSGHDIYLEPSAVRSFPIDNEDDFTEPYIQLNPPPICEVLEDQSPNNGISYVLTPNSPPCPSYTYKLFLLVALVYATVYTLLA